MKSSTIRNILRHFIILIFSFVILYFYIGITNTRYYRTIDRVNYYEARQISSLIKAFIEVCETSTCLPVLEKSLNSVRFLNIYIKKNNMTIVQSVNDWITESSDKLYSYQFDDYTIEIVPREFPGAFESYVEYIKKIFFLKSKIERGYFYDLILTHAVIFLFFQTLFAYATIGYRNKKLIDHIGKLNSEQRTR